MRAYGKALFEKLPLGAEVYGVTVNVNELIPGASRGMAKELSNGERQSRVGQKEPNRNRAQSIDPLHSTAIGCRALIFLPVCCLTGVF